MKKSKLTSENALDCCIYKIRVGKGASLPMELIDKIELNLLKSSFFDNSIVRFVKESILSENLSEMKDWEFVKLKEILTYANIIIELEGEPQEEADSTPESVQLLIDQIKKSYANSEKLKLRHVLDDNERPFEFSQDFINLAIVEQQQQQLDYDSGFVDNRVMNSHEQIYGKKSFLDISQIFDYKKESEHGQVETQPKKILIEGWAGIGKTVLCQKLVNNWANLCLNEKETPWWTEDTKLVVWIQLRNLSNYDPEDCRLGEVVRRECFSVNDPKDPNFLSAAQIEADLQALGDKVTFILDGFDEVEEWYDEKQTHKKNKLTARSNLLQNLLINNPNKHRVSDISS